MVRWLFWEVRSRGTVVLLREVAAERCILLFCFDVVAADLLVVLVVDDVVFNVDVNLDVMLNV